MAVSIGTLLIRHNGSPPDNWGNPLVQNYPIREGLLWILSSCWQQWVIHLPVCLPNTWPWCLKFWNFLHNGPLVNNSGWVRISKWTDCSLIYSGHLVEFWYMICFCEHTASPVKLVMLEPGVHEYGIKIIYVANTQYRYQLSCFALDTTDNLLYVRICCLLQFALLLLRKFIVIC